MLYTALYGRQSLDVKDSISVSMQLEKAKAMCEPNEVCREYSDKGFSGKNTNRPGFIRLMQDIEDGLIRRVIVYKLDRFSRSVLDFCEAWEIMERHHVEFLSVNEKFDTSTPMGKAMLLILMVFAQMERETISERVTDNYYARAKSGCRIEGRKVGGWLGGPAPYGMKLCKIRDDNGKLVPSLLYDDSFRNLEKVFRDYAEDRFLSLGEIARELEAQGVASPGGVAWNNVALSRLFRNPVYAKMDADIYTYYKAQGVEILQPLEWFDGSHAGMIIGKRDAKNRTRTNIQGWKLTLANWQGRIPSEIWLTCQAKLSENKQLGRSGSGKNSWLSGIVKCGHCGHALVVSKYISKNGVIRYFHCTGRRLGICLAQEETIYVDPIENYVENELEKVIANCEDEPYEDIRQDDQAEKIELVKLEEQLENLMNFIASGQATGTAAQYVNERIEQLNKRQLEIRGAQISKKVKHKKVQMERIDLSKLYPEQKKMVAAAYLQKVLVFHQENIELIWNI